MDAPEAPQRAAVILLLWGIPADKREEAGRDFLAFVRAYYRHHGAPLPDWLKERQERA